MIPVVSRHTTMCVLLKRTFQIKGLFVKGSAISGMRGSPCNRCFIEALVVSAMLCLVDNFKSEY